MMGIAHPHADFDMCDSTHCQMYRGRSRCTVETDRVVEATAGQVLAYNGEVCRAYYYAISGGYTESYENVWSQGVSIPYLTPVAVPFEKLEDYTYGIWSYEVSESELLAYIGSNSRVQSKLKGKVVSAVITSYTSAGYANCLTVTDEYGNTVSFTQCDTIRIILSKYAKSARVYIGKLASVNINGYKTKLDVNHFAQTDSKGNSVLYSNSSGNFKKSVLTASGEMTLTPDSNSVCVVYGTGWGHGVGLSQYATKEMALLGYDYRYIATYFFPGSVIVPVDKVASTKLS
jgi:stage II sporulation protein D